MSSDESGDSSTWSREQDMKFENALATYSEDLLDRWQKIAADVPGKTIEEERRKGIAWTEEEHRLFLLGLEKYGKGDWRSISRNFVVTRTPTQVASHAQKYFIRLSSINKDRRRSSIHDITNVNNGEMSVTLAPITGTNGSSAGGSSGKPSKQTPKPPLIASGVGMYGGTTIGQPVGGSIVSGTPVNLPQPAHMTFGMRAPSGQVVPGTPVNMGPMAYSMPQTPAHR
ncbi:Transcription factor SRM1 [Heracleum sosnowskyi]|uniref:Transcription factor SRM1 n=1 Tax=Heracleum sosnowskyi TaxID=360622 RepID=A0AAD8I7M1_9APIA|nr:Transcription factor SRM1 [Heracleum sosnowskyi]